MKHIARAHRHYPAQVLDAKTHEGLRSKWPGFNAKAHRNGRSVPTGCCKTVEYGFLGGGFIQMKRLRIKLRRKPLYIFRGDRNLAGFETHPQRQVVEPLDHFCFASSELR